MCTYVIPSDNIKELIESVKLKENWNCSILFNIHHSLNEDSEYVDLSEILKSEMNYKFPSHFDGIDQKDKLLIALRTSALKSGFSLFVRSSKSLGQLDKHHSAYISLCCQHGTLFRRKSSTLSKRKCQTRYTITACQLCPFKMNISLCKLSNKWYLHYRKGKQKLIANLYQQHLKLHASTLHSHISLFQDKELELAKQCSQIFLSPSRTANLLNLRDVLGIQNQWSRFQIKYILDRDNVSSGLNSNLSSAASLIQTLSNRNDTNF